MANLVGVAGGDAGASVAMGVITSGTTGKPQSSGQLKLSSYSALQIPSPHGTDMIASEAVRRSQVLLSRLHPMMISTNRLDGGRDVSNEPQ
jgi:hypothetical protein